MSLSIINHKLNFLKKDEKKIKRINKYFLYQYKHWSKIRVKRHNTSLNNHIKRCIISEKKKTIGFSSNINSHILKKLISNGDLSNFKKAIW